MVTVIRKYKNRKLYDTTTNRYVFFKDLRQMLHIGETIKVVCHRTKLDITDTVMVRLNKAKGSS